MFATPPSALVLDFICACLLPRLSLLHLAVHTPHTNTHTHTHTHRHTLIMRSEHLSGRNHRSPQAAAAGMSDRFKMSTCDKCSCFARVKTFLMNSSDPFGAILKYGLNQALAHTRRQINPFKCQTTKAPSLKHLNGRETET